MDEQAARRRWWSKITQQLILFSVGVGLIVHEALRDGPERPSLLVLYAGMVGLAPILHFAETIRRDK